MDDFGLKCLAASAAPAVAARATGRGGHAHPGGMAVCPSIAGFIGAGHGLLARAGPAEAYPGGSCCLLDGLVTRSIAGVVGGVRRPAAASLHISAVALLWPGPD